KNRPLHSLSEGRSGQLHVSVTCGKCQRLAKSRKGRSSLTHLSRKGSSDFIMKVIRHYSHSQNWRHKSGRKISIEKRETTTRNFLHGGRRTSWKRFSERRQISRNTQQLVTG